MSIDFHILIPARMTSTRLLNKAMADIHGAPMIVRTWAAAQQAGATSVHVVTDHPMIQSVIEGAGGLVVMTGTQHTSGTDRLSEAVELMALPGSAIVVNLQGDEPLMPSQCLMQVAHLLSDHPKAQMATLYDAVSGEDDWMSPDVVKMLVNNQGHALCFSRAPIPYFRSQPWSKSLVKRHVGLYAYRVSALQLWPSLGESPIERAEALEQWRALSAGWSIVAEQACRPIPAGVDNADDLERVRRVFGRDQ